MTPPEYYNDSKKSRLHNTSVAKTLSAMRLKIPYNLSKNGKSYPEQEL